MAQVTEVTFGMMNPCSACGNENTRSDENGLMRINCAHCGGNVVTFGEPVTREVELTVEAHEDGSATIRMGQ